jgi:hypothetical protein
MNERLDWIEKAGIENMKAHHVCADTLAKEAATTLTVLLAGLGGGLAYSVKTIEALSWNWLAVGATAFTLWLIGVSWYLVTNCLMAMPIPQIYNEPKNLDAPEEDFDYLRMGELAGLQIRIEEASKRNGKMAKSLNLARSMAVASPMVFILIAGGWSLAALVF